ncbi:MAG: class I SAM-dependent methyltransferase [Pseudomonadota bacterium]
MEEHKKTINDVRIEHEKRLRRASVRGDFMELFPDAPPAELLTDYDIAPNDAQQAHMVMKKYKKRSQNIRRAWNRTQRFLPELLVPDGPKYRVLELSTAHGAQLEIARHFGHEVMGCDYANMVFSEQKRPSKRLAEDVAAFRSLNDPGFQRETDDYGIKLSDQDGVQNWPYRPICESINLPMTIFDAGKTPYPFDDKSYDITMCFQAIEHYCHPDDWMDVIDEVCRITTQSIVILLNPIHKDYNTEPEYVEAFQKFRMEMRRFNRNGFFCAATFIHWRAAHGFKLVAR